MLPGVAGRRAEQGYSQRLTAADQRDSDDV
jgi:hypothetical protein